MSMCSTMSSVVERRITAESSDDAEMCASELWCIAAPVPGVGAHGAMVQAPEGTERGRSS